MTKIEIGETVTITQSVEYAIGNSTAVATLEPGPATVVATDGASKEDADDAWPGNSQITGEI